MKVSIIMATFNRSDLIGKAIESVINQTYQDWEMIIIDDASNDNTEEVVKSFNDPRIKYQKLLYHVYYTVARNRGIKEATGDVVCFRDDDGLWHPEFLEEMIQPFSNPDVILSYCGRKSYRGVQLATLDVKAIDQIQATINHPLIQWAGKDTLSDQVDVGDIMVRRDVLGDGFTEERDQAGYCSDARLVDKIMQENRQGKIVLVPRKLHYYFYDHGAKETNMTIKKIQYREQGKSDNELETAWSW